MTTHSARGVSLTLHIKVLCSNQKLSICHNPPSLGSEPLLSWNAKLTRFHSPRPTVPTPAQMLAGVLQDDREQQDLEGECRQVVVEKEHPLHQEEGQVVERPTASTQGSSQHPVGPGICRRVYLRAALPLG